MTTPNTASIPWQQEPDVLAAEANQLVPGGPTTYFVPRPTGNSVNDVTSFHPGQATWSVDSMPDIIYRLYPQNDAWYVLKNNPRIPAQKQNAQGQLMWEQFPEPGKPPRAILDWKILPDKIGTAEHFFFFEAIRRLRPDIRWTDFTMRMERPNRPSPNTLQMRACRYWRPVFCMLAWHTTSPSSRPNSKRNDVLARLSTAQINANTTRGSTPGLVDLALGAGSRRISIPVPRRGQGIARQQRRVVIEVVDSEDTSEDEEEEGSEKVFVNDGEADEEPKRWDDADDGEHEDSETETDDHSIGDAKSEADAGEESSEGSNASDDRDVERLEGPPRDNEAHTTVTNSYSEEESQNDILPHYHSLGLGDAFPTRTGSSPIIVDEELFESMMSNEVLMPSTPNLGLLDHDAVDTSTSPINDDVQYAIGNAIPNIFDTATTAAAVGIAEDSGSVSDDIVIPYQFPYGDTVLPLTARRKRAASNERDGDDPLAKKVRWMDDNVLASSTQAERNFSSHLASTPGFPIQDEPLSASEMSPSQVLEDLAQDSGYATLEASPVFSFDEATLESSTVGNPLKFVGSTRLLGYTPETEALTRVADHEYLPVLRAPTFTPDLPASSDIVDTQTTTDDSLAVSDKALSEGRTGLDLDLFGDWMNIEDC